MSTPDRTQSAGEITKKVGRTTDARGRAVTVLDPLPLYMMKRSEPIAEDDLERIVGELEPDARSSRRWLWCYGPIALAVVVGGLAISIALEGPDAWNDLIRTLTNPAIMVAVIGGSITPIITARRRRLGRVRRVMLRARRCPHCGYDLRATPAGEDGITTCGECAAAWRVDEADRYDPGGRPDGRTSAARRGLLVLLALGLLASLVAGIVAFSLS